MYDPLCTRAKPHDFMGVEMSMDWIFPTSVERETLGVWTLDLMKIILLDIIFNKMQSHSIHVNI